MCNIALTSKLSITTPLTGLNSPFGQHAFNYLTQLVPLLAQHGIT
jgi:hypothetical protein